MSLILLRRRTHLFAALLCLALGPSVACSSSDNKSPDRGGPDQGSVVPPGKMLLRGTVLGASAAATPLQGAEVQASVDANKDGKISADEITKVQTDKDGKFQLAVSLQKGEAAVVRFRAEGKASVFRRILGGPGADVTLNVSLADLLALQCSGTKCAIAGSSLSLEGLAAGTAGKARVFNPVTETDQFPGAFRESTGKLLRSGVFAAIELVDGTGKAVSDLASPATLRMALPKETWSVVADITTGNDRIDVPFYYFDEVKGTWVREGQGYLEDSTGKLIPETGLASIKNGSFTGPITVRGDVKHLSYWNCDWPVETFACVAGKVVTSSGQVAPEATVYIGGVTFTASFDAITVGNDGRFCVDVLRSELPTEDLDGNGKMGEVSKVSVHLANGGRVYEMGHFAVGTAQATCPSGCTDIGDLALIDSKELKTALEGHWNGDWGNMVLRQMGSEYWGAYDHDEGTVVVRAYPDGSFRGWWSEVPSRQPTSDAGEVEFRFSWTNGVLSLDGRWRYGVDGDWHEDWDLQRDTQAPPAALEQRFNTPDAFKRHP